MKKAQFAIAVLMISATANLAYAENLLPGKDMDFINLAQGCAPLVAPQTMAAIVKTESQFQPLAIGINNRAQLAHQPKSKEEAIITATSLIAKGYNIDMGLGQVNSANLVPDGIFIPSSIFSLWRPYHEQTFRIAGISKLVGRGIYPSHSGLQRYSKINSHSMFHVV